MLESKTLQSESAIVALTYGKENDGWKTGQKSDVRFGIKLLAEAEHLLNAADEYFANAGMMPNSQARQILERPMISTRNAREHLERLFG